MITKEQFSLILLKVAEARGKWTTVYFRGEEVTACYFKDGRFDTKSNTYYHYTFPDESLGTIKGYFTTREFLFK